LPPVSAQDRKKGAVLLLTIDAGDDYLSPRRKVTPSAFAALPETIFSGIAPVPPQAQGYAIFALGNSNADFGIQG